MAPAPHTLTRGECEALLRTRDVGRVAVSTPQGPHIVPVSYRLTDVTAAPGPGPGLVARVGAYSVLGSYGGGAMLAFEVDSLESAEAPWSVVVRGRGELLRRFADAPDPRTGPSWAAQPWSASGPRSLYLRLPLTELSGRRLDPVGPPL
jgi:uncharacterized protein